MCRNEDQSSVSMTRTLLFAVYTRPIALMNVVSGPLSSPSSPLTLLLQAKVYEKVDWKKNFRRQQRSRTLAGSRAQAEC